MTAVSAPKKRTLVMWTATGSNQIWMFMVEIDPYWIDFTALSGRAGKWRWRMWADHGLEFFIHPAKLRWRELFQSSFDTIERGGLGAWSA